MTWWAWVIVWVLLVAASLGFLFQVGRSLWSKASRLFEELGTASERLAVVTDELGTLAGPAGSPEPAVFADPAELRRQHDRARRRRARGRRARASPRR